MSRIETGWALTLVGMAMVLRVVVVLWHPMGLPREGAANESGHAAAVQGAVAVAGTSGEFEDSGDYAALGRALAQGKPYEVNGMREVRMPGYPVFVAAIFALSGNSIRAVLLVQAVLGGATVWLTYLLGRRIGRGIGLLAAGLAAFDPLSVGFSAALLSEIPFALCLMVGVWLAVRIAEAADEGGWWRYWIRWLGLGVVWGIGVYLRAEALWCIVPLASWAACCGWVRWRGKDHPKWGGSAWQWIAGAVVAVAVMFACLMPWLIRNYEIYHSGFLRLTSLEGISLYEAVYPGADGGPKQGEIRLPPEMEGLNEAQRNDAWEKRAWGFVRSDPARMLRLGFIKVGRTWSPFFHAADFRSLPIQLAMGIWYVPVLVLGLLGVMNKGVGAGMRGALLLPLGYFTLIHALFLGSVRYRVALMPLVCVLAAVGVMGLAKWVYRAQPQPVRRV